MLQIAASGASGIPRAIPTDKITKPFSTARNKDPAK